MAENETPDADPEALDQELINEVLDRKPSPYPKLFQYVPDKTNAFLRTGHVFDGGLTEDFFALAREAAARVVDGSDKDQKIIPVLFLYRHAVELALKVVRRALIRIVLQHDKAYQPGKLDRHELKILMDDVRGLHRRANPYLKDSVGKVKFISAQAEAFIGELDEIDPTGEGFRYSAARDGSRVLKDADVGIDALIAGMLHIEKELDWYASMLDISADLIADWTAEMEADYGSSF